MKKLAKNLPVIALALLAVGAGAGCKKYMDVQPVSQIGIGEAFSTVNNAYNAVIGVYDELQGDNGYGIRINLYYPYDSDEGIVSGNIDNGRRGIGRYQLLLTNAELRNPFNQLYRGVERANLAIEQIPQMALYNNGNEVEKRDLRRLHGEVLTLRAQFLFELIRNWGDVPAPMVPSYRQTNVFLPRVNRDSTYDRILADLALAKTLVPWRTEVARNERITKGAVMALRARIALFRGGFSLRTESKQMERRADYLTYYRIARDECAELMQRRDQHTLNPNFENVWRNVNSFIYDPFGEILFEVGAGGGNSNSDSRMGNYDGPSVNAASRFGPGGGGILALPIYLYAFDSVDTRRDVTITRYQVNADSRKQMRALTAITNGKYRRDWRVPALPGSALNLGYNWVLIRFSDVLLMFAEAENEINNGPNAAAIAALEEVRRRAFRGNETLIGTAPTDKAGFFDAIVRERYLEFGFEAIRKYDLIRWNLLGDRMLPATGQVRTGLRALATNTNMPQYMWWRWVPGSEEFEVAGSMYKPTITAPTPAYNATTQPFGWQRVNWREDLLRTNNTLNVGNATVHYIDGIAHFFTPNKSELFPFDQTTLDSYQGRLSQNPGY